MPRIVRNIMKKLPFLLCLWLHLIDDAASNEYTLHLLHVNDFHARFEQTSIYSGRCTPDNAAANNCFGGFARLTSKVNEIREKHPNTIFVAAGDYFQGTIWYTAHKWKPVAEFLNLIPQDVMALGNHEFDDGVDGLVPFIDNVTFPVLACNVDTSLEPSIDGKIKPSVVVERSGRKIGVIGYLTTETLTISDPGKIKIIDEVTAVQKEAKRLKQTGVDIIIAVGHAGFKRDIDVATGVEDIDIVIGGHTNTFLYSGKDPSVEPSVDDYPSIVIQKSGRKVPVVQAYAFGKYLGHLEVTFDGSGELIRWGGNPILLDDTVPQDSRVLEALKPWRRSLEELVSEVIGRTYVFLDGNRLSCRMKECNLGNLAADAIVHQNAKYPDDMHWARTALAVVNGGGIRGSIDERSENGSITMEDVLSFAPFQNTIDIVELKGRHVKEMFEHSVSSYDTKGLDPPGGFLQVSGFKVRYDLSKPVGSRVVHLQARCVACRIPIMADVEDEEIYEIAMPSFIAAGGDSFAVVRDNKVKHHLTGLLDTDIYSQYIRLVSPMYPGTEGRITFVDAKSPCDEKLFPSTSNSTTPALHVTPTAIQNSNTATGTPVHHMKMTPELIISPVVVEEVDSGIDTNLNARFEISHGYADDSADNDSYDDDSHDDTYDSQYDDSYSDEDDDDGFKYDGEYGNHYFTRLVPKHNPYGITAEGMIKQIMDRHDDHFFSIGNLSNQKDDSGDSKLTLTIHPDMEEDFYDPDPEGQKQFYSKINNPLLSPSFKVTEDSKEDNSELLPDDDDDDDDADGSDRFSFVHPAMRKDFNNPDPEGQRKFYNILKLQPHNFDSQESSEVNYYKPFGLKAKQKLKKTSLAIRQSLILKKSNSHKKNYGISPEAPIFYRRPTKVIQRKKLLREVI